MKPCDLNGDSKEAAIYVEPYLIACTSFVFFDYTLMATFLLVSCSNKNSTTIEVVHSQGRKKLKKTSNKEISQVS